MKKLFIAIGIALFFFSGTVIEVSPEEIIYGCVNNKNGHLRIVNEPGECRKGTVVYLINEPPVEVGADCWKYFGSNADLRNCDLSNTTITYALVNSATFIDLSGANLANADIASDISFSILTGANLRNAHFTYLKECALNYVRAWNATLNFLDGSNLSHGDFRFATIGNANFVNLTGANLWSADLTDADLTGANLNGAFLMDVLWSNTTCPDGTNSDDDPNNTCEGHLL